LKKLLAILLLVVLLFNIVGYKFVANYFELKATNDLQESLYNKKYAESDLVTLKLPFVLPYTSNSKEFESFEGNIDIKGINYQYVKKRIYNDTLELLCIPNFTKTSINNAKNDFANQLNDFTTSNTSKKLPSNILLKSTISDFTEVHHFDIYTFFQSAKLKHGSYHITPSSFDLLQRLEQPPKA
jgi:hypothetical protein